LKQTFHKEVNAIARRASKNGNIKIVEKAISSASRASTEKKKRNTQKWHMPKRSESSNSDSSNESINVMEAGQRIPCKKRFVQRTIRFDYKGNQVDILDSDSDHDRKMPAKISLKKPKKVADPLRRLMKMRTTSKEEKGEE
jgi:FKBP-type peptidyl-prolyl cis-trans isomerase